MSEENREESARRKKGVRREGKKGIHRIMNIHPSINPLQCTATFHKRTKKPHTKLTAKSTEQGCYLLRPIIGSEICTLKHSSGEGTKRKRLKTNIGSVNR